MESIITRKDVAFKAIEIIKQKYYYSFTSKRRAFTTIISTIVLLRETFTASDMIKLTGFSIQTVKKVFEVLLNEGFIMKTAYGSFFCNIRSI